MNETHLLATGRQGNERYFGSLQELMQQAPKCPLTGEYSEGSVYVYRAPDMRGGYNYARENPCFYIFLDKKPGSLEEAFNLFGETGLQEIADAEHGCAVVISPINEAWGAEDVFALSHLMLAVNDSIGDLFGSLAYNYAVGIGNGATFLNSYVCRWKEAASRFAAAVVIGGTVEPQAFVLTRPMPIWLPVYLASPDDEVLQWYLNVNKITTPAEVIGSLQKYALSENPVVRVIVDSQAGGLSEQLKRAWKNMLRYSSSQPIEPGRNSYMDSSYFAPGWKGIPQELGLFEVVHENSEFLPGTDICRWYALVPEEAASENGDKVPLILAIHGNTDDARGFLDRCGFIHLAGKERVALLSASHQHITEPTFMEIDDIGNKVYMFDKLISWMLEKFPCIDTSRIYCTGFSRGGINTCYQAIFNTNRYAAVAPLSGMGLSSLANSEESITLEEWCDWRERKGLSVPELPALIMLNGRDVHFTDRVGLRTQFRATGIAARSRAVIEAMNILLMMNGVEPLERLDFTADPFWGFSLDYLQVTQAPDVMYTAGVMKGSNNRVWYVRAEGMEHCLYYGFAQLVWEFFCRFRRNPETGAIEECMAE